MLRNLRSGCQWLGTAQPNTRQTPTKPSSPTIHRGNSLRHFLRPDGQTRGARQEQVTRYRRKMMYKAEIGSGILVRRRWREHLQIGIRKVAGLLPEIDTALCTWSEDKRSLFRAALTGRVRIKVLHVVAPYLVFGAISARLCQRAVSSIGTGSTHHCG